MDEEQLVELLTPKILRVHCITFSPNDYFIDHQPEAIRLIDECMELIEKYKHVSPEKLENLRSDCAALSDDLNEALLTVNDDRGEFGLGGDWWKN